MNYRRFKFSTLALAMSAALATNASANTFSFHKDFRDSYKVDFNPVQSDTQKLNTAADALNYLKSHQDRYAIASLVDSLELDFVKTSLTGKHYYFQQYLNDSKVYRAQIVVSVDNQNQVKRIYNNTFPVTKTQNFKNLTNFSVQAAENVAWEYLQVTGKLLANPKSEQVFLNYGSNFELAYKINYELTQPRGSWQFFISSTSGKVLKVERTDLPTFKQVNNGKIKAFAKNDKARSLTEAVSEFTSSSKQRVAKTSAAKADATASVFDPDPRTTLNLETLEDTSPASSFDAAYISNTLRDVELDNGTYRLNGPWISIVDWDAPTQAPSTSTSGQWTATRGDNAFNDANVYFHIDQNQRYIQSLGFTGATGIQELSMEVDTNGANGADNSFYTPGTNRLSFGHGCVDDAEDVDVILHEYGHALHFGINPSWGGSDSGAIGEGFGDYWAASYSYSTPNGLTFHPEWAFSWDGHNNCWGGRQLDRTNYRYDSNQTYGAHQIVNGQNGDEIWSTPLAQSLIDLLGQGVPREEVDQIVLESQFGLGSGITMPIMAASVVSTANTLFPNGPHAGVFNSYFQQMDILSAPLSLGDLTVLSAGSDTVVDPGDTVSFNVALSNSGGLGVSQVSGTVSTQVAGVIISSDTSNYADIASGNSANNSTPFELTVPANHVCGDDIRMSMDVDYFQGSSEQINIEFTIPVGASSLAQQQSSPALSIPDNNTTGVSDTLTLSGATANSSISVDVNITHTYRGDLRLVLTSPAGTSVTLKVPSNDSGSNLVGNYPDDFAPNGDLSAFDGEDHNGTWTLRVSDEAGLDLGTLNSWSVISASPQACNGGTTPSNLAPIAEVANGTITVNEGDQVTLDASGSSDPESQTLTYAWAQTGGLGVNLSATDTATVSFTAPQVTSTRTLNFEVTVSDPTGASDTETVVVTINDVPDPDPNPGNGGGNSGGGSFGWLLAAAGLLFGRKKLRK